VRLLAVGAPARSTISGSRSVSTLPLSTSRSWLFDTNRTLLFACASLRSKGVGRLVTTGPPPKGLAILTCSSRGILGSGDDLVVIFVVVAGGVQSASPRLKRCSVVVAIVSRTRIYKVKVRVDPGRETACSCSNNKRWSETRPPSCLGSIQHCWGWPSLSCKPLVG
jgi:hypothetical protein